MAKQADRTVSAPGALERLVNREEILQICYWYQGEGLGDIYNLLVIGEHFKIWPEELVTIEIQLEDSSFGDFVLSELEINRNAGEARIVGENPLAPEVEKVVEKLVTMTQTAVAEGVKGLSNLLPLTMEQLTPLADVCHNQLLKDCYAPARHH